MATPLIGTINSISCRSAATYEILQRVTILFAINHQQKKLHAGQLRCISDVVRWSKGRWDITNYSGYLRGQTDRAQQSRQGRAERTEHTNYETESREVRSDRAELS